MSELNTKPGPSRSPGGHAEEAAGGELKEFAAHWLWFIGIFVATGVASLISAIPWFKSCSAVIHLFATLMTSAAVVFVLYRVSRSFAAWYEPHPRIGEGLSFRRFRSGFIRKEALGWVVLWLGGLAAFVGAVSSVPAQETRVLQRCWSAWNLASFDLTRAAVLSVITLFFLQILKVYENTLRGASIAAETSKSAASLAKEAAECATRSVHEGERMAQQVREVVDVGLMSITGGFAALEGETSAALMIRILRELKDPARITEVYSDVLREGGSYLRDLTQQFTGRSGEVDRAGLVAFCALFLTYLQQEALNFEKHDDSPGGCRFPTRFETYATAVRKIVVTLNECFPQRFKYYTVLNRTPRQFFNLEDPGTNLLWMEFLEEFCRRYLGETEGVPEYFRYFLACSEEMRDRKEPPYKPTVHEQYKEELILCAAASGHPIFWQKGEREELKKRLRDKLDILLPEDVAADIRSLAAEHRWDGYIVANSAQVNGLRPHLPTSTVFKALGEELLKYHHPSCPPMVLSYNTVEDYEKFFSKDIMPRDLFAVWDTKENEWFLCLGSMMGHWDPLAVRLVYAERKRPLQNLPWSTLDKKLNMLFRERDKSSIGAVLHNMGGGKA
jgi:hypothetical protein